MRIRSFHMNGFGIFADQNVEGLADGINLFLGNNEAGKSTTLGFFRTMLFGYPAANSKAEVKYAALRGGAEGGGLLLHTDSMGMLRLQRKAGTHGGPLTLTTADGKPLQPDLLDKLLGGVTRELFRTVYGFSLTELQNFESLDGDKVGHILHSASFGAGSRPVGEVLKDCNKSLDELFKPRASKPVINSLLKEIGDVKAELRTITAGAAQYDEKLAHAEVLEANIAVLRGQIESTSAELNLSRRKIAQWERWTALQEAENLLAAESPVIRSFPAEALTRFESLQREIAEREQRAGKAQASLRQLTEQLAQAQPDNAILQQAAEIQALVEGKTAYTENLRELTTFVTRKEDLRGKLDHLLTTLGPDWTPEQVQQFDLSLFTRERIDRFNAALAESKAACTDAQRAQQLARAADDEADTLEKQARAVLESLPQPVDAPDESAVSRLIAGRDRMDGIVRSLPAAKQAIQTETERLKTDIADISPAWSTTTLYEFETSVPARQYADQLAAAVIRAEAEQISKHQQHEAACTTAARLKGRYNDRKAALDSLPAHATPEGLAERRTMLRNLREALHKFEICQTSRQALADRLAALPALNPAGLVCGTSAIAGAMALPVLWHWAPQVQAQLATVLPSVQALYVVTTLLAACGACLAISARPKRDVQLEQQLEKASTAVHEVQQHAEAIAQKLELPDTTREAVDSAEHALEHLHAKVEERSLRQHEADAALRELNETIATQTQAQEALASATACLESARNDWAAYLQVNNLPETVLPANIGDIFARVSAARERATHLEAQQQLAERDNAALQEYLVAARCIAGLEDLQPQADMAARIDRWIDDTRRQEQARRHHAEASRLLDARMQAKLRTQQILADATLATEAAETTYRQQTEQWKQWLEERGLNNAIMPETARVALDNITEASRTMQELQALHSREQSISEQVQRVHRALSVLCDATGRTWHQGEALQTINGLAAALEQAKNAATRQKQLSAALPETKRNAEEAEQLLAQARARYHELLEAAGAQDEESFRTRAGAYGRQEALRTQIAQLTAQLHAATTDILPQVGDSAAVTQNAISNAAHTKAGYALQESMNGPAMADMSADHTGAPSEQHDQGAAPSLDRLRAMFAETTRDHLEARAETLQQELTSLHTEEETLHTDLHETKATLRALETSDQTTRLLTRRESLTENLRQKAHRWATLALARHFVEQAKNTFEKERQPAVIKAAAEFLQIITDGAYTHIQTSLEDGSIRAVTAQGDARLPAQLSRGTAEQLYLALRLGYISNHAAHGEPLPVIMDDILVNFDPHRAACTARAFARLAQRNQVLFFTCHPATAEMMQKQAEQTALFTVKDGTITA